MSETSPAASLPKDEDAASSIVSLFQMQTMVRGRARAAGLSAGVTAAGPGSYVDYALRLQVCPTGVEVLKGLRRFATPT